MQHPVLKTLFARLRAFEAVERASFALATIHAMMEPFERHRVRIDLRNGDTIAAMGSDIQALYGHLPESGGLAALFRLKDRAYLDKLIRSLTVQEMACHFGATSCNRDNVPVALEGLIVPEPPVTPYGGTDFISICLIPSDFPSERIRLEYLEPMQLGPTRFLTLDNRGPERARLFKARWPAPDRWRQSQ